MKASSQKTFEMLGGGQGGQRERKRGRERGLQHVGFLVIDTNQTQKPLSELLFCLFVGFCWLFACRMRSTRCVTEISFDIKCPFHFSSSNQACLIREPVYSTQSYRVASVCSSDGISYASSKILLLHAPLCPGLSQPLLLLSNQPHCCSWP